MSTLPWLPIGYALPRAGAAGRIMYSGPNWQIIAAGSGTQALLAHRELAERWHATGLLAEGQGDWVAAWHEGGARDVWILITRAGQMIRPVSNPKSPDSKTEAVAFAVALKETRKIDSASPFHDAIYVEHLARLLPTYGADSSQQDDLVLGQWLSGGASVSAANVGQIQRIMSWMPADEVSDVVQCAGVEVTSIARVANTADARCEGPFELVGRAELSAFFQEHVIDIAQNAERYRKLGIESPAGIVLFGPTGCGKTFAVERLIAYLGWPRFEIDATSVASPYIHETSKKVADVFNKAIENKPSVLVIDEMDAFLARRDSASGQHHVEEVAEFLRRIPEAISNGVLVIGMTNRIDSIDPAILRRGRFDHLIEVLHANEIEVLALMQKLVEVLPVAPDVMLEPIARELSGRPLSDVTFVVREGARLAVRAGHDQVTQKELLLALDIAKSRNEPGPQSRPIGFY